MMDHTNEVLQSSEFVTAKPETVEFIFQLANPAVTSELDLVWALERYINFNKTNDSEIAMKVRPASNSIRFLTLSATDIATTSLLTLEEKLSVIECLPPKKDLTKMPTSLSSSCIKRNKGKFVSQCLKKMIDALNGVYKENPCRACEQNGFSTKGHSLWECTKSQSCTIIQKTDLKRIYDKYKHIQLISYDEDDLKTVYEIYKLNKFVA